MESDYKNELELAISLAREAGTIMLRYFDSDQQVHIKSDMTPVTIADTRINSMVIKEILEIFPEDGIVGEEESTALYGLGRKWICDPIDGTSGYVAGVPTAAFSLAFVVDGIPMIGVVYDPFLDKMYIGQKGVPSVCNGKTISVSELSIDTGIVGVIGRAKTLLQASYFKKMTEENVKTISVHGSVYKGLLVAKGRIIGFIEPTAVPHDVAALHVIVEGAGGKITALDGSSLNYSKTFKGVIVSNTVTHKKFIDYCRE